MASMGADDIVVSAKLCTHPRGHCLLPGAEMDKSWDLACSEKLRHLLLKSSDSAHLGVQVEKHLFIDSHHILLLQS